jgi:catechol 2,3-dioxygenase-like lactoylglutathione lyase family enzyme
MSVFVVMRTRVESIGRRSFITVVAGTAFTTLLTWGGEEVPPLLDHFILGCDDLDRGVAFVEQRTGVRAAFGGVHPGRGTRNALLSLGERRYLEIMAPDPAQNVAPGAPVPGSRPSQITKLRELREPRLVGWAAHPGDLEKFAARLRDARIEFEGPRAGSRQRPDGKIVHWKTLTFKDDKDGLLPFFIEWSADSIHPSSDAPKGCRLTHFAVVTPNTGDLTKMAELLQVDMPIASGDKIALQATILGPKGELLLTS